MVPSGSAAYSQPVVAGGSPAVAVIKRETVTMGAREPVSVPVSMRGPGMDGGTAATWLSMFLALGVCENLAGGINHASIRDRIFEAVGTTKAGLDEDD